MSTCIWTPHAMLVGTIPTAFTLAVTFVRGTLRALQTFLCSPSRPCVDAMISIPPFSPLGMQIQEQVSI